MERERERERSIYQVKTKTKRSRRRKTSLLFFVFRGGGGLLFFWQTCICIEGRPLFCFLGRDDSRPARFNQSCIRKTIQLVNQLLLSI